MIKAFLLLSLWLIYLTAFSQKIHLKIKAKLPKVLYESSGLEFTGQNKLWTHNDSGSKPELFQLDSNGKINRIVKINNVTNIDWEELTQDEQGNFYIGDFGNNGHRRKNLRILKIPNPDSNFSNSVTAEIINFNYSDQENFPPPTNNKNFDMEAMIFFRDSLYLFSKNWTKPFNGYTKMYRLSNFPGNHTADLIDSFYTGAGSKFRFWITSADISPNLKYLALLSSDRLWLFTDFKNSDFFSGNVKMIKLSSNSQKEAICFINNHEIYITDERFRSLKGGKLYHIDLQPFLQ